ncbi:MAG TPA: VOC family protein [Acidimicrobiales bacterium]|jgi:predicted enzyme related to lactoylglutathione lyase
MEVLTSRTIIHPGDLDRALAFYRHDLGLAVAREFGDGAHRGVVFFAGGGLIEVTGGGSAPGDAGPGRPAVVLWLQVRDLDASLVELAGRGVPVIRPAALEPWGLIEAWIEDPDGLRIHLVQVPDDHPLRRDLRGPSDRGRS